MRGFARDNGCLKPPINTLAIKSFCAAYSGVEFLE
jgi:hypothetical protein